MKTERIIIVILTLLVFYFAFRGNRYVPEEAAETNEERRAYAEQLAATINEIRDLPQFYVLIPEEKRIVQLKDGKLVTNEGVYNLVPVE